MSETIKIEESSGNVFLDIGFPEEEAEYLLLRTDLAFEVHRALDTRKLNRTKIAELLELSPEEVAHLRKPACTGRCCFKPRLRSLFDEGVTTCAQIHGA